MATPLYVLTKSRSHDILNTVIQLTEVEKPHGVWLVYADRLGDLSGLVGIFCTLTGTTQRSAEYEN